MNRTEQEKEFIYLLGQLREKGQPGDYMAVILAVEALAAGQPGIVIDKHHLESRLENPEASREMLGEDVEAVIDRLRATIAEYEKAVVV